MSLELYKRKRSFTRTPEPVGGKSTEGKLVFVVQKHQASHLHYDFRLEMRGVLKSWAVPKGPSMNPDDRRLAQLVEDHPFDYKDFEGIIPEGNYGAGTVIIWDQGSYETVNSSGNKELDEKDLLKQFYAGKISFILKGKKLKGGFSLVKTPARGENAWLLFKLKDAHAHKRKIPTRERSVVSGLTLEQMASNKKAATWKSNRSDTKSSGNSAAKTKNAAKTKSGEILIDLSPRKNYADIVAFIKRDLPKASKSVMPADLKPMEATLTDKPFNSEEWQFEIKWDGYRVLAYMKNKKVQIRSKANLDFNKNYPPLVEALKQWGINAVIDGEIVVLNAEGKSEFNALQNWPRTHEGHLFYHVFDILWLDGMDLTKEPLYRRREILKQLVPENSLIRFSDSIDEQGVQFFKLAKENGLEGIIAKRRSSNYTPFVRTKDWLKIPVEEIKEYVIVGYTESGSGRPFARILFGNYHKDGKLYYVHHTGGGLSDDLMNRTYSILKKNEVKKKPVVNEVEEETPIHWVKPVLVGRFKEKALARTPSGRKRHPVIYLGLREDIPAHEIVENSERKPGAKKQTRKEIKGLDPLEVWRRIHGKEITQTELLKVEGREIQLINFEHPYWAGITKLDVVFYYQSIAGYILPYLKNRPLGLRVISEWAGENKEPNFIRNMKGNYPPWMKVITTSRRVAAKEKSADIDWVLCNDLASLIYILNLGAVDLHPWAARVPQLEYPDYIVIDLDPDENNEGDRSANSKSFQKLIRLARGAKTYFDQNELKAFVKTSGKTGLHILIPCKGIKYGESRMIAENICKEINNLMPEISTINPSRSGRKGKIYLDASQNDYSDRLVAPYCIRAYKQPFVSAPLEWSEINNRLKRNEFTIHTMVERLREKGDIFKDLLDPEIAKSNTRVLKRYPVIHI